MSSSVKFRILPGFNCGVGLPIRRFVVARVN